MASGAEHFKSAEHYRQRATTAQNFAYDAQTQQDIERGRWQADYFNVAAQVHATLALAAATAMTGLADIAQNGEDFYDAEEDAAMNWAKAVQP